MNSFYDVTPRQLRALVLLLVLLPLVPTIVNFRFMAGALQTEQESAGERFATVYSNHLNTVSNFFENQIAADLVSVPLNKGLEAAAESIRPLGCLGVAYFPSRGEPELIPTGVDVPSLETLGAVLPRERLRTWPANTWLPLPSHPAVFGLRRSAPEGTFLFLRSRDVLARRLLAFFQSSFGERPLVTVASPGGEFFPQAQSDATPLAIKTLVGSLPGWRVLLHGPSDTDGEAAQGRGQILAYQKIGIGMVVVIFVIASLAGYALTRQMRLNELHLTSLAAVAHELKTPLASIRLLVETLAAHHSDNPAHTTEYLDLIARENRRLTKVVDNFLTLSRLQSKTQQLRLRPVDPMDFIGPALEAVEVPLKEQGFQIETDYHHDARPVLADPEAMTTVLVNLLENAIKYSGDTRSIRLSTGSPGKYFLIEIADRGIGMEKNALRHIFRPFHQVNARLSRSHEGCGLGLAIVRHLVEGQNARIAVRSQRGQGTTFSIGIRSAAASRTAS